eukprot:323828_1
MESLITRTCLRARHLHIHPNSNVLHHQSVRYWLARHKPPKPRRRYYKRMDELEKRLHPKKLPIFDKVFNNFVKLAHPDQLQAFGEQYKATNATSWAKLNEVIRVINVKPHN